MNSARRLALAAAAAVLSLSVIGLGSPAHAGDTGWSPRPGGPKPSPAAPATP